MFCVAPPRGGKHVLFFFRRKKKLKLQIQAKSSIKNSRHEYQDSIALELLSFGIPCL